MRHYIILSSCVWGPMLQRPHQMALAMARAGHQVSFIAPGQVADSSAVTELVDLVQASVSSRLGVIPNLIVYPVVDTPAQNHVLRLTQFLIDSSSAQSVVVCYLPRQWHVVRRLNGNFRVVYDCVDEHQDLAYSYGSTQRPIDDEYQLIESADLVLATSSALYLNLSFGRDRVYLSKNAVPPEAFDHPGPVPDDLASIPSPRIIYVGAVYDWFDEALFYTVVKRNPDLSFVVLGPVKEGLLKCELPNMYVLGVKPHEQLKDYLFNSHVGIIPFKDDRELIIHCDPIKMYEYLACGLPVVSTAMPELYLNLPFVYPSHDPCEFSQHIRKALACQPDPDTIASFLSSNTWPERVAQLDRLLDGRPHPRDLKQNVRLQLTRLWQTTIESGRQPFLLTLFGLALGENDPERFVLYSQRAYELRPTRFTLRYYVTALYLVGALDHALDVLLKNEWLAPCEKAELVFAVTRDDPRYFASQVFMCIQHYHAVRDVLGQAFSDTTLKHQARGHYYMASGQTVQALEEYSQVVKTPEKAGPVLWHNLAGLHYRKGNRSAAERFRRLERDLTMQLLGKS